MANIFVTDLQPAGSSLFSDAESFVDSMQDLSQDELKMTFGGKKHGSGYGSKKGSKNKHKGSRKGSSRGSCGCGYGC